jgi:Na+-transporting methylmalonyl-CoA/oxaloacetate decarboxylase gamma subunit
MARQGGIKRFVLTVVFIALLIVVFILVGGGDLLKQAGKWVSGMGKKAEDVKEKMEEKAETIEKTVEKLKESDKSGGRK